MSTTAIVGSVHRIAFYSHPESYGKTIRTVGAFQRKRFVRKPPSVQQSRLKCKHIIFSARPVHVSVRYSDQPNRLFYTSNIPRRHFFVFLQDIIHVLHYYRSAFMRRNNMNTASVVVRKYSL